VSTVRLQSVSVQINNASFGGRWYRHRNHVRRATAYELYVGYNPTTRADSGVGKLSKAMRPQPSIRFTLITSASDGSRVDASKNWVEDHFSAIPIGSMSFQAYGSTEYHMFPGRCLSGALEPSKVYGTQVSLVGVVPLKSNTAMFHLRRSRNWPINQVLHLPQCVLQLCVGLRRVCSIHVRQRRNLLGHDQCL